MSQPDQHQDNQEHFLDNKRPQETIIQPVKKPKPSRRKKKKDPNEPTKPVSAYALFFRDRQASIKGRNPNMSFGEVSKMVASMWDNLDADSKAHYKKRTEMAKKEYLRALAAYRANMCPRAMMRCMASWADILLAILPTMHPCTLVTITTRMALSRTFLLIPIPLITTKSTILILSSILTLGPPPL